MQNRLFWLLGLFALTWMGCSQGRLFRYLEAGGVAPARFRAEIPVQRQLGLLFVEVEIKGNTYRFLFDSGALNLLDERVAAELGLTSKTNWKVTDASGLSRKLPFVVLDSLSMGGIVFGPTAAAVANLREVPELKCLQIDGFIGANLMREAVWQVDFEKERLLVAHSRDTLDTPAGSIRVPFVTSPQGTPYLQIVADQDTFKRMALDLGSNASLDLPRGHFYTRKEKHPWWRSSGVQEASLYGKLPDTTYQSFFREVALGDSLVGSFLVQYEGKDEGYIGTRFLESFLLTLDWNKKEVLLSPRQRPDSVRLETFGFSVSVAENQIRVTALIDGGPADRAGLRLGDRLLFLNGEDFINIQEDDYCRLFLDDRLRTTWPRVDLIVEQDGMTKRMMLERTDLFKE